MTRSSTVTIYARRRLDKPASGPTSQPWPPSRTREPRRRISPRRPALTSPRPRVIASRNVLIEHGPEPTTNNPPIGIRLRTSSRFRNACGYSPQVLARREGDAHERSAHYSVSSTRRFLRDCHSVHDDLASPLPSSERSPAPARPLAWFSTACSPSSPTGDGVFWSTCSS